MAKRKKEKTSVQVQADVMRRAAFEEKVEAMQEGRRQRAQTFRDRKRDANRKACRGAVSY